MIGYSKAVEWAGGPPPEVTGSTTSNHVLRRTLIGREIMLKHVLNMFIRWSANERLVLHQHDSNVWPFRAPSVFSANQWNREAGQGRKVGVAPWSSHEVCWQKNSIPPPPFSVEICPFPNIKYKKRVLSRCKRYQFMFWDIFQLIECPIYFVILNCL